VTRKSIFSSMSARAADEIVADPDDVPSSARKVPRTACSCYRGSDGMVLSASNEMVLRKSF